MSTFIRYTKSLEGHFFIALVSLISIALMTGRILRELNPNLGDLIWRLGMIGMACFYGSINLSNLVRRIREDRE